MNRQRDVIRSTRRTSYEQRPFEEPGVVEETAHHDMSGVDVAAGASANNTPRYSSSPELSSPPVSDTEESAQQLANEHRNSQNPTFSVNAFGVDGKII